eukprot:6941242-Karenia_brevis.AAC.1
MLPREYQEEILKLGSGEKKLEYESIRGYVLNLAQQKASAMQPRAADVFGVDNKTEQPDQENQQEKSQEYAGG